MKRLVLLLAIVLVAISPARAQLADHQGSTDRPFQAGGKVWMNLSAGDYNIRPASDTRIVVRWEARTSEDARRVRVAMRTEGAEAWIETDGPKNNVKVTIEVPARSDLHVRMSAGDLRIEGIEGNKDVSLWAGDLNIDVGRPSDYSKLEASVKVGDLEARPFSVSKGGIMRSFSWQGTGRYSLNASLFAGDLTLYSRTK